MMDDFHTYDITFNMIAMPLKKIEKEDIRKNFTPFLFSLQNMKNVFNIAWKGSNVKKFLLSSNEYWFNTSTWKYFTFVEKILKWHSLYEAFF